MASHESLPDDQRAILQLLLKQGKTYDELAALLKADPTGVRRRAHAAIATLGPDDAAVGPTRRREIADYLLGQHTASQRAATREFLEDSAPGRAWARSVAGALRPLGGTLPEIPAEPVEVEQAFDALDRRTARQEEVQRGSRRGGMLVFAGLGLILAIGLVWVLGGFDTDSKPASAATSSTSTTSTTVASRPLLLVADMQPPAKGSVARGVAGIGVEGAKATLTVGLTARGLPTSPKRGAAYGMWLYNSASQAVFVGFSQTLVKGDGRLQTLLGLGPDSAGLRSAIGRFGQLLLTLERTRAPKRPGTVILRGRLRAVSNAQGSQQTTQTTQTQTTPGG